MSEMLTTDEVVADGPESETNLIGHVMTVNWAVDGLIVERKVDEDGASIWLAVPVARSEGGWEIIPGSEDDLLPVIPTNLVHEVLTPEKVQVLLGNSWRRMRSLRRDLTLAHQRVQELHASHEERMGRLTEALHTIADEKEFCDEFDDFMERNGLPRRSKDWEVTIDVTYRVRVTVSATTEDEANDLAQEEELGEHVKSVIQYDRDTPEDVSIVSTEHAD